MTDDHYRDMVQRHDKSIDMMSQSIEHLASAVGATNRKLEDIVDVISRQNILMEKFTNLEINLKESFGRVYEKIRSTEKVQSTGCPTLGLISAEVKTVEGRVKELEDASTWIMRTLALAIISVATTFFIKG